MAIYDMWKQIVSIYCFSILQLKLEMVRLYILAAFVLMAVIENNLNMLVDIYLQSNEWMFPLLTGGLCPCGYKDMKIVC